MDRRTLLARTAVGAVGVGIGIRSGALERQGQAAQEQAVAGLPGGPLACQVIWSVPTSEPLVALTFDDGPDPEFTPRILAVLARYGVRATFNVMGWNAVRHAGLLRAVAGAGHELGNHTWTHEDLTFQSPAATSSQLERGRHAIETVAGVRPRFFRPPRGELTGAAVRAAADLGHDILLWSVTRGPAGVGTPAMVAGHLGSAVAPGDVVALHDGIGRGTFDAGGRGSGLLRARRSVEVEALPAAIEKLLARNLRFVTASGLAGARSLPPAAADGGAGGTRSLGYGAAAVPRVRER